MSFRILSDPIDPATLRAALVRTHAGACVVFEGWVRDLNEGRPVVSLEYEAFTPLAEREGDRVIAEARGKFSILDAACVHRTGILSLGDLAVWVGVTAAHRGDAFEACRYIIDQAKKRIPVWKRERYADGSSAWIEQKQVGFPGGPS